MLFFSLCFFFFNATATTEIYTLSLHDALPIYARREGWEWECDGARVRRCMSIAALGGATLDNEENYHRSEEHTSELQSRQYLVCRLLLEKKKKKKKKIKKRQI